jgi:hypothetical protein
MAGLGLFYQKSAIAVTMPIFAALKFCVRPNTEFDTLDTDKMGSLVAM